MFVVLVAVACSSDPAGTEDDITVTDTVSSQVVADLGEIGVVVDVRDIARRGYVPAVVTIAFAEHPAFDTTLEVNAITGVAILHIANASLSQAEQDAFADGVSTEIVVLDAADAVLATRTEADLVLDASGSPLLVSTTLPRRLAPLVLKEQVPYLLQPKDANGVLVAGVRLSAAEVETDMAGGVNGTDRPVRCPDGAVAVGHLVVREEPNWPGALRLRCMDLDGTGTIGATVDSVAGWLPTQAGDSSMSTCPTIGDAKAYLVRDQGDIGTQNPYGTFVRNVQGICRTLGEVVSGLDNAAATVSAGQVGKDSLTDTPYDLFCPAGSVVTGIRGRVETTTIPNFRRVGYYCRAVVLEHNVAPYVPNAGTQRFYFTAVPGADDQFLVRESLGYWVAAVGEVGLTPGAMDADTFLLERDDDGWAGIRLAGTTDYVVLANDGRLELAANGTDRFRLITDDIEWTATDRGLTYHDPIKPPATLEFAYAATIRNCSPAIFTEAVGKEDTRARVITTSTSESVQLFSQNVLGAEAGVKGSVFGAEVEIKVKYEYTRSTTSTKGATWSSQETDQVQVSRVRTIEIPPFTAVEAFDAIQTVRDVRVPFTHVLRFTGQYGDGTLLTGTEILTQMVFNLVDGVPTAVGPEYVDIGIRGETVVDRMFEVESRVNELPGACN